MKFSEAAIAFKALELESSRNVMTEILADLFARADAHEANLIAMMTLGEIHPQYIGTQFNIAKKHAAKVVALVLGQDIELVTAGEKKIGDIGAYLSEYSWESRKALDVRTVYERLCEIEALSGAGSQDEKIRALADLLRDLDPLSAKYVIRIVVGKLRLGFSDMTVLDALSYMLAGDKSLREQLENAYNIRANIGLITQIVKESGISGLVHLTIQVGTPILLAAAERLPTAQKIFDKLGPCVAQPKLDGFRLQIHIDKTKANPVINFFSRNLQNMSAMFPDLIPPLLDLPVTSMIAEGEAISFDLQTGEFLPFQETVKRKRKHGITQAIQEFPLKVFLFDLLYLDGNSYLGFTHEQRRQKLLALVSENSEATVQVVDEKKIEGAKELERYFVDMIGAGLEGLVVKRPDAIYIPGKRNFNWIKLKRQEQGELEDTIDAVILGYYAGSGRRAQFGIGAFLVGIYNKQQDRFETVAKVGTGLSDIGWVDLKARCDEVACPSQPKNVWCARELFPDVWVYPELVCSIRADEITQSPIHTAGKAADTLGFGLRFPRFMSWRPDRQSTDATTMQEIKRLYEDQF